MDYAASEPMTTTDVNRREPVVRSAVDRLERLAVDSDELVEELQSTFSPVLFHGPPESVDAIREREAIPGSDLGQSLMRLADRIDGNFRAIRGVIASADV